MHVIYVYINYSLPLSTRAVPLSASVEAASLVKLALPCIILHSIKFHALFGAIVKTQH